MQPPAPTWAQTVYLRQARQAWIEYLRLDAKRENGELSESYHVNIRVDEAGYFVARCVELPAAMTQAKTEEEVICRIKEVIHLVLEATRGEQTSEPTLRAIELVA